VRTKPVKDVPRKELKELSAFWQSVALEDGEIGISHSDELSLIRGWGMIEMTHNAKRPPVKSLFKKFPARTIQAQMVEILSDLAQRLTKCADGDHIPLQKIGEASEVARGYRPQTRENEIRGWMVCGLKKAFPTDEPFLSGLNDSEIAEKLNRRFPSPHPDGDIDPKRVAELRKELNIPAGVPVGKRGPGRIQKRSGKKPRAAGI
jgi:hypothetical protein